MAPASPLIRLNPKAGNPTYHATSLAYTTGGL